MAHHRPLWSLLCVLFSCTALAEEPASPGKQHPERLETQIPVRIDYLLYLPEDYDSQPKWPLLLFLHGSGERGDNLDRVKIHGPPKLIAAGKQFPFIVVSPQCPQRQSWDPRELTVLLDDVEQRYHVDPQRVYVTGLSMGGFGTWQLAAHSPDRFAAIAPICGGGDISWARKLTRLPVWAFHGAKDRAVPLDRSQVMINALQELGGDAKLTVYPEAEHDSWTETYDNPQFYDWLLSHTRAADAAEQNIQQPARAGDAPDSAPK